MVCVCLFVCLFVCLCLFVSCIYSCICFLVYNIHLLIVNLGLYFLYFVQAMLLALPPLAVAVVQFSWSMFSAVDLKRPSWIVTTTVWGIPRAATMKMLELCAKVGCITIAWLVLPIGRVLCIIVGKHSYLHTHLNMVPNKGLLILVCLLQLNQQLLNALLETSVWSMEPQNVREE